MACSSPSTTRLAFSEFETRRPTRALCRGSRWRRPMALQLLQPRELVTREPGVWSSNPAPPGVPGCAESRLISRAFPDREDRCPLRGALVLKLEHHREARSLSPGGYVVVCSCSRLSRSRAQVEQLSRHAAGLLPTTPSGAAPEHARGARSRASRACLGPRIPRPSSRRTATTPACAVPPPGSGR